MFTLKRTWVAWIATALVAAVASAGDYWSEPTPASPRRARTVQYNSMGRKVTVWRDLKTASSQADPNNPFEAPDDGESPREEIPGPTPAYQGDGDYPWADYDDGCGYEASCCDDCCCLPFWAHRTGFFGEYLFLRPTGVDVAHALQQADVSGFGPTPAGLVGTAQPVFSSGYRAGFALATSQCSSIGVAYTNFHSHVINTIGPPDGGELVSLVIHPNSATFGIPADLIGTSYDIDFQNIDVEYRALLCCGCRGAANFVIGGRYGKLVQQFEQLQVFGDERAALTTTDITFEGGGLRTGLDGQWCLGGSQLALYGKGFANVLFGQFRSNYNQYDSATDPILQATSNWTDNRVVPVLEYEAGLRWNSCNGRWSVASGYYAAFWFNSITTSDFIQAVQTANFTHVGQTVAFDGLVSRLEFRF